MSEPADAPALAAAPVSLCGIVLGLALLAGGVVLLGLALLGFVLWSLVDGVVVDGVVLWVEGLVLWVADGLEEVELGDVISGLAGCALDGLLGAWLLEAGVWSELCGCAAVGFCSGF